MPPSRCSSPGVPGTAHGRASVSGSRRYGRSATEGIFHGSEPLARYPSDRKNTGVRYVSAMRTASRIASKQSPGEHGATIGTGASPLRPYIACNRSDCSVLVGNPVDGPPRWMSQMTSGISSDTASPIDSPLSAIPGPDDDVTASAQPNDAPIAAPMPAISSSAWNVRTPNRLCFESSCRMSDAGVIGYAPRNSGSSERFDAAISPYASARLPLMLRYVPVGSAAGLTS